MKSWIKRYRIYQVNDSFHPQTLTSRGWETIVRSSYKRQEFCTFSSYKHWAEYGAGDMKKALEILLAYAKKHINYKPDGTVVGKWRTIEEIEATLKELK